jgi:hypothetical protein
VHGNKARTRHESVVHKVCRSERSNLKLLLESYKLSYICMLLQYRNASKGCHRRSVRSMVRMEKRADSIQKPIVGEHALDKGLSRFGCLGLLLPYVIAPAAQRLYYLGENGCSKRYSEEDERLVDNVREAKLRPDSCSKVSIYQLTDVLMFLQASALLRVATSLVLSSPSLAVASASSLAAASWDFFPASGNASRTRLQKALLTMSS